MFTGLSSPDRYRKPFSHSHNPFQSKIQSRGSTTTLLAVPPTAPTMCPPRENRSVWVYMVYQEWRSHDHLAPYVTVSVQKRMFSYCCYVAILVGGF
ncbi:hypothetical protein XELAEV_18013917mg [Xenopus laevis]|uniref:Uncharacterized protein n=1 Tax=Xenopus laevis TaxID=8355 RepID=A0A974HZH2_XENLA|nr:hypothetical protein XELAEV_18013917mg [Xenopus laevis]